MCGRIIIEIIMNDFGIWFCWIVVFEVLEGFGRCFVDNLTIYNIYSRMMGGM